MSAERTDAFCCNNGRAVFARPSQIQYLTSSMSQRIVLRAMSS